MCDLEGDIETVGLLIDSVVNVSSSGQVGLGAVERTKKSSFKVKGVYSCVACSVVDILPMLGHTRAVSNNYVLNENYIPYKKDILKEFNELGPRAPGVCLVKEGEQLLGVLIDVFNKARVLGVVTRVLPQYDQLSQKKNVLLIGADGQEQLIDCKTIDLDNLAETDATVGIVSLDGFLLLQPNRDSNELTLILSHGYLVLQGFQVVWTRQSVDQAARMKQSADDPIQCKHSQVSGKEIFVVNSGVLLPSDDQDSKKMSLVGSHNAIVNYQAFKRCLAIYESAQRAHSQPGADDLVI